MLITKVISDKQFIQKMATSYEDNIYKKIPEADIYKRYLEVKYGEEICPEGTVTKIVQDFIHYLVDARLRMGKNSCSV